MSTHQTTLMPLDNRSGDGSADLRNPIEPVLRLLEELNARLAEQTSLLSEIRTNQTLQEVFANHGCEHGDTHYGERHLLFLQHKALTRH